jgi:hypothetical protein
MAFSAANLVLVGGAGPGSNLYLYKSDTDDREDVMAHEYFDNKDDNINLAADDIIQVTGDKGFYKIRVTAVASDGDVSTEIAEAVYVPATIADQSATTSSWAISPVDGKIRRMWAVNAVAPTDDTTIGLELAGTNVTDAASADIVTVSASDAAGTVNTGEADTANTVTTGAAIEITCGGEGSTAGIIEVLIEIVPCGA